MTKRLLFLTMICFLCLLACDLLLLDQVINEDETNNVGSFSVSGTICGESVSFSVDNATVTTTSSDEHQVIISAVHDGYSTTIEFDYLAILEGATYADTDLAWEAILLGYTKNFPGIG